MRWGVDIYTSDRNIYARQKIEYGRYRTQPWLFVGHLVAMGKGSTGHA